MICTLKSDHKIEPLSGCSVGRKFRTSTCRVTDVYRLRSNDIVAVTVPDDFPAARRTTDFMSRYIYCGFTYVCVYRLVRSARPKKSDAGLTLKRREDCRAQWWMSAGLNFAKFQALPVAAAIVAAVAISSSSLSRSPSCGGVKA